MKKRFALAVGAVVAAGLLGAGLRYAHRVSKSLTTRAEGPSEKGSVVVRFVKNPEPVPQFIVRGLDGEMLFPALWRGKVVLLNFWATWCPPCRAEIPDLVRLQTKYAGRLQIVGLSLDEGPAEAVQRFAQQVGMNYPVAIVTPEFEARFGGVLGLPTSFLLDQDERVVQKHIGLRDPTLYEMEIRALLGLPVEAKIETFDDIGQVFLANAARATELPGIDFSKLTAKQKRAALRQLNEQKCTCGCGLTLAQCRINDTGCPVSVKLAQQVVEKIARGQSTASP